MTQTTRPTKENVRAFTQRRAQARTPPPTPAEIRRQLGWNMIRDERAR